jgi:8-oxo-dGTP pyrophosphatase MutT (NUDIX family)
VERNELIQVLQQYDTSYPEEKKFLPLFLDLLKHPRAYFRDHFPGHMTGSAWILDQTRKKVLLTHHAKLNRWLQPGGHADGEENIVEVALKEAREETGINHFERIIPGLFDVDIHLIPGRKDTPAHHHYDIRILLSADSTLPLLRTEESHDLRWVDLNGIEETTGYTSSITRMVQKARTLFPSDQ